MQALDCDLEDAEEQHGTAVRGHLQLIDSLQDMQYARMKTMQEHFQSNLRVSFHGPCCLLPYLNCTVCNVN